MRKIISNYSQRGDTIIEVMLAIAVVGMVLGASYRIANRALQTGRLAQEQTEALKIAESQIEKLKYKASQIGSDDSVSGTIFDTAATETSFCIADDAALSKITTNNAQYAALCKGRSGLYDQIVTYDGSNNLFKVVVTWPSPITNNANVEVAYKLYQ